MDIPWVIEPQTRVKHELLKRYISPWMKILFNNQARYKIPEILIYFDGFSGPGIYYVDDAREDTCPGSPLIVAEKANSYIEEKPTRKVTIFCIDKEKDCVDCLSSKLAEMNRFEQKWEVHRAEFDKRIHEILDEMESSCLHYYPMFFFIDPFGYTGYSMDTLKRILGYPRPELFINFMIYDIVRYCEEENREAGFIKQFGSDDFKGVGSATSPEQRQAFILNVYCENLKSIANATFVMPFRINTPEQGTRPRYYLIHASKHLSALKTMKDKMAKVSDVPYRFEAIGVKTQQMSLFDDPEKVSLIDRILNYCKEKHPSWADYDELENWAYVNTNGVSKTIKETLMDLAKEDKIEIERGPIQHKNTVTSGAKIRYKSD